MNEEKKIGIIHSIGMKIVLLVTLVALNISLILVMISTINSKSYSKELSSNYILSMAELSARTIDDLSNDLSNNKNGEINYANLLKDVKMEGINSSYAYKIICR